MKEHIIKHITEQKVILSSVFTQVERLSKHLPVSSGFMDTIKGIDEMLAETIISKERNREL